MGLQIDLIDARLKAIRGDGLFAGGELRPIGPDEGARSSYVNVRG
jgi:hypothetical protein